jgi:cyclic pyranopterin phosphate synthase
MTENMSFLPKTEILTLEELEKVCAAFIDLGVKKIRITGGEPLVRKNIMTLVKRLGSYKKNKQLEELTMTTNGELLKKFSSQIYDSGIRRINVSLDTLNAKKFSAITRGANLNKILAGIAEAKACNLRIKINMVALKGVNDDDFDEMIRWCGESGFDLTLIEVMPMGEMPDGRVNQYLPLSIVRSELEKKWTLQETNYKTPGPARYTTIKETGQRLGFITPMTHNFCESCNRIRVTCTGQLYMCLGRNNSMDLRRVIRKSDDPKVLTKAILSAMRKKPKGHDFVINRRENDPAVLRHMNVTGG